MTEPTTVTDDWVPRGFVPHLIKVCAQPGPRADLRRALRRTPESDQSLRAHRYIAPFFKPTDHPDRQAVLYAVGSYIAAYHPKAGTPTAVHFGQALALATRGGRGKPVVAPASIENRLMNASRATLIPLLYQHMPSLLDLSEMTGNSPDWHQLTRDLLGWPFRSGHISKRWMQDYYQAKDRLTQVETYVRDKPGPALAIALAIGLGVGLVLRGPSSRTVYLRDQ